MAHGFFDHAAALLRRPDVAGWLAQRYGIDTETALRAASRRFGWQAWSEGAWRQLRGLTPFARSFVRLLRP